MATKHTQIKYDAGLDDRLERIVPLALRGERKAALRASYAIESFIAMREAGVAIPARTKKGAHKNDDANGTEQRRPTRTD